MNWQPADDCHACVACGQTWKLADLKPLTDLSQRAGPTDGPSGECPACGALCWPGAEASDLEVFQTSLGTVVTYGLVREAMQGTPYTCSLVGTDSKFVEQAVNVGIDARLQACFVPSRGDSYKWVNGRLKCVVSQDSLPVLLRRLYESADEEAHNLADDMLRSLCLDVESGRLSRPQASAHEV